MKMSPDFWGLLALHANMFAVITALFINPNGYDLKRNTIILVVAGLLELVAVFSLFMWR